MKVVSQCHHAIGHSAKEFEEHGFSAFGVIDTIGFFATPEVPLSPPAYEAGFNEGNNVGMRPQNRSELFDMP
jgi:hypothetical protein